MSEPHAIGTPLAAARLISLWLCAASGLLSASSVSGTVYERHENQVLPLPRVTIIARSLDTGDVLSATKTDAEGRYRLVDLPAARFSLTVSRHGYYIHSAKGRANKQVVLDCTVAEDCSAIDFELWRAGVISGLVVDKFGEPVQDVMVRAQLRRRSGDTASSRTGGNATTDDRGVFRIAGLKPGRYVLEAWAQSLGFSSQTSREKNPVQVEVRAGEEIHGIRMILQDSVKPSQSFQISGRVTGIDLSTAGTHMIGILSRQKAEMMALQEDGSFLLVGVLPGRHALFYSPRRGHPYRLAEADHIMLGELEVDRNISGLVLKPMPPTGFSGVVRFESESAPGKIGLSFISRDGLAQGFVSAESPDYEFESTRLLPGTYGLHLALDRVGRENRYLKGIRRGSDLVPPRGIDIAEGEIDTIEVVISDDFAKVFGRVKAAPKQARDGPIRKGAQFRVGLKGAGRIRWVQADQRGRFSFDKVVPGEYRICAWPNLLQEQVDDEKIWEQAGSAVRTFPVESGSEIEIDLTAVP